MLDNRLLPKLVQKLSKKFSEVFADYKKSYPNVRDDDGRLFSTALELFLKFFKFVANDDLIDEENRFAGDCKKSKLYKNVTIEPHKPDALYWENPKTNALDSNIWWHRFFTDSVITSRLVGKNFIYPPNTPRLYIGYLTEVGGDKMDLITPIKLGNYGEKNPAGWFASKNIGALTEWLTYLYNEYGKTGRQYFKFAFNAYNDNPIKLKNASLHGNLGLVDLSAYKLVDDGNNTIYLTNLQPHNNEAEELRRWAIGLIPDYPNRRRVLAEFLTFKGVNNLNVIDEDNPKDDQHEDHEYLLFKEIGKVQKISEARQN